MSDANKPICVLDDLNKRLPNELVDLIHGLFEGDESWRVRYNGMTPKEFLSKYGIDYGNLTVRDAVALDVVKLDDKSVSNDSEYTFNDHIRYSQEEYERFLLNKNFRINLVNVEPEWTNVYDNDTQDEKTIRTVDMVYQGVVLSKTVLGYFKTLFEVAFDETGKPIEGFDCQDKVYVPFTNGYDLTTEISLIPNTHYDFSPITTRAYYDRQHLNYVDLLNEYGITAVSSFALVDPEKGKTHTGEYLIKVQKKVSDYDYRYIVARMDSKGQFCMKNDGKIDITLSQPKSKSPIRNNTILCVCESDMYREEFVDDDTNNEEYRIVTADIPMEKSTTSSHYSVFEQRIPDYELKYVRNYIQFKTRLEGMELCLAQLKRDIERKEIRCAECFEQETFAIRDLFREFDRIRKLIDIQTKFYQTLDKYDDCQKKQVQLDIIRGNKDDRLRSLMKEYSECNSTQMDRKIELGQKIKSLKLEIDKNYSDVIDGLVARVKDLCDEMRKLKDEFKEYADRISSGGITEEEWGEFNSNFKDSIGSEMQNYTLPDEFNVDDDEETNVGVVEDALETSGEPQVHSEKSTSVQTRDSEFTLDNVHVDVRRLLKLVKNAEMWRDYMFSVGYELNQMQEMLTIADDNTIKVRRLIRNFEDRMKDTEEQVWDSNHVFKSDFSFTGITTSSLRDIILLHDWYACNAPQKTYDEMGFKNDDEFLEFRKKCNRISLDLRKHQYTDMLYGMELNLQESINDLRDKLESRGILKYKDKYGWEAKADEKVEKVWSISDVDSKVVRGLKTMAIAYEQLKDVIVEKKPRSVPSSSKRDNTISELKEYHNADIQLKQREFDEKQYKKDFEKVTERTVNYLIDIGMIKSQDELENLALRNKVMMNSDVNVYEELECVRVLKETLDGAVDKMKKHRGQIQKIIDRVYDAEKKIRELKLRNKEIFNSCIYQSNKQVRNKLLLEKLENEQTISKLTYIVNTTRKDNLEDFTTLEKLRDNVDNCQKNYDKKVREFKLNVGVNQEVVNNLVMHIYNKYQDEILDKEVN